VFGHLGSVIAHSDHLLSGLSGASMDEPSLSPLGASPGTHARAHTHTHTSEPRLPLAPCKGARRGWLAAFYGRGVSCKPQREQTSSPAP
jgi:hypothetical protein